MKDYNLLTGNCILTDLPIKDSQFHTLTHWGELWEKKEYLTKTQTLCRIQRFILHEKWKVFPYYSVLPWLGGLALGSTLGLHSSQLSEYRAAEAEKPHVTCWYTNLLPTCDAAAEETELRTFLPAKRASKKGSTRFFLFPSPPKMSLMVWTNASSTEQIIDMIYLFTWCCSHTTPQIENNYYSWSYSVECLQLWRPSVTAWPIAEPHQPAAADYSQCHLDHHFPPFSPAKTREKRSQQKERERERETLYLHEERGSIKG